MFEQEYSRIIVILRQTTVIDVPKDSTVKDLYAGPMERRLHKNDIHYVYVIFVQTVFHGGHREL